MLCYKFGVLREKAGQWEANPDAPVPILAVLWVPAFDQPAVNIYIYYTEILLH